MGHINEFYQMECGKEGCLVRALSRPIDFNLIVTKRCNSNCKHCCASANESMEDIPLDTLKRIVKIAEDNEIFYFVITGGEPLLYPYIWELFEMLKGKFGIVLNTNATLIDNEVAKKLAKYNIANVIVSLDAPNEKIYSEQRGSTTKLSEVLEGIKALIRNKVPVSTKLIITQINRAYIEDVVKMAISLGVRKIKLAWFKPVGRGSRNHDTLAIPKEEVTKVLRDIYQLRKKYQDKMDITFDDAKYFPFLLKDESRVNYKKLCGDYFCRIDYKGDLYPCPFLDIKIGNIFTQDLDQIWQSPKLKNLRSLNFAKNLKGCEKCKNNKICIGGCRARALFATGQIDAKDPLCWA